MILMECDLPLKAFLKQMANVALLQNTIHIYPSIVQIFNQRRELRLKKVYNLGIIIYLHLPGMIPFISYGH